MRLIAMTLFLLILCALIQAKPVSIDFTKQASPDLYLHQAPLSAPVADFSVNDSTLSLNGSAYFTDHSINSPTSWSWTFQGGTPSSSSEQNPQNIVYNISGSYDVSLTVTNADGSDTKIKSQYIYVNNVQPAWLKQNTGFTSPWGIKQISIVDTSVVWAMAYDVANQVNYINNFTRTTNGGTTWTPGLIAFTGSSSFSCSNIFAISATTAYACMSPNSATGGKIVKTTDGGIIWNVTSAAFPESWANFVYFFNANDGVAMGDPNGTGFVIITTSDGGTTWSQVSGANIPNTQSGEYGTPRNHDAVGNTIWFPTNAGYIYKSTDKGLHWDKYNTGYTAVPRLIFKDENIGFAVNSENPNNLKKTIDGGVSWSYFVPEGAFFSYPHLDFVPGTSSTWVCVSSNFYTKSSYSTDDCSFFYSIDQGIPYTTVKFYDIHTGWAGGITTTATDGGIYKWNKSFISVNADDISKEDDLITVYPNPAHGLINIQFEKLNNQETSISLHNLIGQTVMSKQINAVSNDVIQIDCTGIEAGWYFISIVTGGQTITKKIVIIK